MTTQQDQSKFQPIQSSPLIVTFPYNSRRLPPTPRWSLLLSHHAQTTRRERRYLKTPSLSHRHQQIAKTFGPTTARTKNAKKCGNSGSNWIKVIEGYWYLENGDLWRSRWNIVIGMMVNAVPAVKRSKQLMIIKKSFELTSDIYLPLV